MNFIYADDSRNLLHLIYAGTLDAAAAQQVFDAVKTAAVRLQPGFDLLADLRDLKAVHKDAISIIAEQMNFLNTRGVGKIIRILPEATENFGFAIMSIFHYGHDVRFVTCLKLEEAVAALSPGKGSSKKTPDSIRPPADKPPKPPV